MADDHVTRVTDDRKYPNGFVQCLIGTISFNKLASAIPLTSPKKAPRIH